MEGQGVARGDNIEKRLIDFAVMIIQVTDQMPQTRSGNHLAGQLVRSGTSPAAHYAEARGAESDRGFLHKLKLCFKELNESRVWLQIIAKSRLLPVEQARTVYRECDELCRIVSSSIKTTQIRMRNS